MWSELKVLENVCQIERETRMRLWNVKTVGTKMSLTLQIDPKTLNSNMNFHITLHYKIILLWCLKKKTTPQKFIIWFLVVELLKNSIKPSNFINRFWCTYSKLARVLVLQIIYFNYTK